MICARLATRKTMPAASAYWGIASALRMPVSPPAKTRIARHVFCAAKSRDGSITALTLLLQSRGGYVGFQILLLLSPARLKRLRPDPGCVKTCTDEKMIEYFSSSLVVVEPRWPLADSRQAI